VFKQVYTVHKRTAKTVTISGPTLEERNVTRRLHVADGEEWFGIGGSDRVGARDRDGARMQSEPEASSPPSPPSLHVPEQDDGLDNADFWELAGILYTTPGPVQQGLYEEMVMSHAGGQLNIRHGDCGNVFVIERNP